MVLTAALLVLHAAPLEVRVLERERPTTLTLEARSISCDGVALVSPQSLVLRAGAVQAGAKRCAVVNATGDVSVKLAALRRAFPGALRVSAQGSALRVLNLVDVEDYLPSVVEAEADGFPPAALEVQAVVSRTFAVTAKRHRDFGLCDLAHCQVYRGVTTNEAAHHAVDATAGQLLLADDGAPRPAYFHASCGGHTSTAQDVFGEVAAGRAVADASCATHAWSFSTSSAKWAAAFNVKPNGSALEVLRRDAGGRVLELRVFGKKLSADAFLSLAGRAFGWRAVRSARFTSTETRATVSLSGSGTGHGVGFCQLGAKELAGRGASATEILQHYFPDAHVAPVANKPE